MSRTGAASGDLSLFFCHKGVLIHHLFIHEDGATHAHGYRDRVTRARVNAQVAPLSRAHGDACVVSVLAQLVHDDVAYVHLERLQDAHDEVMCEGARRASARELEADRVCLSLPDVDWQVAVRGDVSEHHDAILVARADADGVNSHFNHSGSSRNCSLLFVLALKVVEIKRADELIESFQSRLLFFPKLGR